MLLKDKTAPIKANRLGGRLAVLASALAGSEVDARVSASAQTGSTTYGHGAPVVVLPDPAIMGPRYSEDAGRGMLDHELAHVRFSMAPQGLTENSIHHVITNILEDRRIELRHVQDQPGASGHLLALNAYFMPTSLEAARIAPDIQTALQAYLLVRLVSGEAPRHANRMGVIVHRALDAHWREIAEAVASDSSTTQSMAGTAKRILSWLARDIRKQQEAQRQRQQEQRQRQQEQRQQQEEAQEQGQPEPDGKSQDDDGSGIEVDEEDAILGDGEEEQPGEGDAQKGEGEEDGEDGDGSDASTEDGASTSGGGEGEEEAEGEGGEDGESQGSNGGSSSASSGSTSATPQQEPDYEWADADTLRPTAPARHKITSASEQMAEEIRRAQEDHENETARGLWYDSLLGTRAAVQEDILFANEGQPAPPVNEKEVKWNVNSSIFIQQEIDARRSYQEALLRNVRPNVWKPSLVVSSESPVGLHRVQRCAMHVPVLRAKFAGALKTRSRVDYRHGLRDGDLDPQALPFSPVTDRVFQREVELGEARVSLQICLDQTGSMNGAKWQCAREALELVMAAVEGLPNLETRIVCWGTPAASTEIKGWTQRWASRRYLTDTISPYLERTYVAPCVMGATRDLLGRKQSGRRICLVISDGACHDQALAALMIQHARAAGIEVYGLGIVDYNVIAIMGKDHSVVVADPRFMPQVLADQLVTVIRACAIQ